jgi:hypothetical protein
LAGITPIIATGRAAPNTVVPSDDSEWRKRITASLWDGDNFVLIDNFEGEFNSPILASALTAEEWCDRELGSSRILKMPQRATWIVTGNNIRVGGDLARRRYPISMDAKMEQPWLRTGFKYANLERYIADHRGELIAAILTLARAWHVAGRPSGPNLSPGGCFDEWAFVVGGILAFAGVSDFLGNVNELWGSGDSGAEEWRVFLLALHRHFGSRRFPASEVCELLKVEPNIRNSLPNELAGGKDETLAHRLGIAFGKREKRRLRGGLRIERAKVLHGRSEWLIVTDEDFDAEVRAPGE